MSVSGTSRLSAGRRLGAALPACAETSAAPRTSPANRPRRVALIRQNWRPDGGAARQVNAFLEFFAGEQYQVALLTAGWTATLQFEIVNCKPWALGRVWREWAFARNVQKTLARREFDLVQSHERIAGCDVYRAGDGVHREWLRQKARVQTPLERWFDAVSPYHAYVKWAEKRMFESQRLRAVICNSRMSRDDIRHWFAMDPKKLHVIYNGVDTERFHPHLRQHRAEVRRRLGVPDDAPLFIFVGSALRHKGLAVAIEGLAQTPGGYLVVVGKDKHAGPFLRQARRWGVADRVKMAGVQSDVGPYYGAADALVLPSLYDIFPNVALEAMATGLPVATSAKCGAAELIVEGENGYVRDALDGSGFAHALQQLTDPQRRERMSRAARAAVEPLNLDATRRRLNQLYHDLLDERT